MLGIYLWILFLFTSIVLVVVSRQSLRDPRSHGFYRFFAWEFIAVLLVLNLPSWFTDPLSWHQVISWILLILSLILLIMGVVTLKKNGRANNQRSSESHLLEFEKTTNLVTTGIFKYIRHPMYSSLLLLNWGVYFKTVTWAGLLLAVLSTICLFLMARADENECLRFFGEEYRAYIGRTKRFLPFLLKKFRTSKGRVLLQDLTEWPMLISSSILL